MVLSVARAFQPEICPLCLACLQIAAGAGFCWLLVSREGAKGKARGGGGIVGGGVAFFEYEYEYRPPGRTEYEWECDVFAFFVVVLEIRAAELVLQGRGLRRARKKTARMSGSGTFRSIAQDRT